MTKNEALMEVWSQVLHIVPLMYYNFSCTSCILTATIATVWNVIDKLRRLVYILLEEKRHECSNKLLRSIRKCCSEPMKISTNLLCPIGNSLHYNSQINSLKSSTIKFCCNIIPPRWPKISDSCKIWSKI